MRVGDPWLCRQATLADARKRAASFADMWPDALGVALAAAPLDEHGEWAETLSAMAARLGRRI
jgi:hypothetical protein